MKNKKKATSKIRVEKIGGSTSAGNSKYFRLVSERQIEGNWECRRGDSNPHEQIRSHGPQPCVSTKFHHFGKRLEADQSE